MPRYFVRFPDRVDRADARPMLDMDAENYRPFYPMHNHDAERILIADLSDEERQTAESNGCEVFEDVQFYPVPNKLSFAPVEASYTSPGIDAMPAAAPWLTKSVTDVMDHIKAPVAWVKSRGKNVTIGIVDTGVSSEMPEFPMAKRSLLSKSFTYASPWDDPKGHGSMCACAATATDANGGKFNGVAPDAHLMSLRTSFKASDIYRLYDWVIANKKAGNFPGPVVMSNSYAVYSCSAPSGLPSNHPYYDVVKDAVAEGIPVIFAAGNNHHDVLCNHDAANCGPNSIWAVNSADEVMSIGTVNWDNKMDSGQHANSSRGPGDWASAFKKPDCVAPTYGEIVWGSSYKKMEWWGTSGACPQVAGLAALLLSIDSNLTPAQVYDAIRDSCDALTLGPNCAGAGVINCEKAVINCEKAVITCETAVINCDKAVINCEKAVINCEKAVINCEAAVVNSETAVNTRESIGGHGRFKSRESGFIRFSSIRERDEFARRLILEVPSMEDKCFLSRRRPHIVVEHLTPDEQRELQRRLSSNHEWFDDLTLEPQ